MATVQLAPRNFTPTTPYSAVQASPQAAMMEGSAISEAGRALQQTAGALQQKSERIAQFEQQKRERIAQFEQQKRDHINRGVMASEDTHRINLQNEMAMYVENNPADPKSWRPQVDKLLAAYEANRQDRMKEWDPAVIEQDTLAYGQWKGQALARMDMVTNKGLIVESNAKITANAEAYLRAGQKELFVEKMKTLNGTPEQIEQRIRTGLEEGTYNEALNKMDTYKDLPNAQAFEEYENFIADLTDQYTYTNEDGEEVTKYSEWEYKEGGMAYNSRVALLQTASARRREAQRAMDVVGYNFAKAVSDGTSDRTQLNLLLESGAINEATANKIQPTLDLAEAEAEKERKEEESANFAKLSKGIKDGTISRTDIDALLKSGDIDYATAAALEPSFLLASDKAATALEKELDNGNAGVSNIAELRLQNKLTGEDADRLTTKLKSLAAREQGLPDGEYSRIMNKVNTSIWRSVSDLVNAALPGASLQPGGLGSMFRLPDAQKDDKDYQKIGELIRNAKVTQPTRDKLAAQFFYMKAMDLRDLQEEGTGTFMDRDLTEPERKLRTDLITLYGKGVVPVMGAAFAGDLMFVQEALIRKWFDANPDATPEEVAGFRDDLMKPVREVSGSFLIEEMIIELTQQ
jgi:hypothetical protein